MTDKQFYTEFLRQANKYVNSVDYDEYICEFSIENDLKILRYFGKLISQKMGVKFINWAGIQSMVLKSYRHRREVMTELISYLKQKLKEC